MENAEKSRKLLISICIQDNKLNEAYKYAD